MTYYKQCELTKGTTTQVAWIPEVFATIGRYIRIRSDNGWRVISAGRRIAEDYLLRHERDYLTQRQASDI